MDFNCDPWIPLINFLDEEVHIMQQEVALAYLAFQRLKGKSLKTHVNFKTQANSRSIHVHTSGSFHVGEVPEVM